MARTTSDQVISILRNGTQGGDYDDVNLPDLTPYIDTASVLVTRVSACSVSKGKTLSTEELELIERWLAAYYYALSDQVYQSKTTEGASASFQGTSGLGLDANRYGQGAKSIDFSGCLVALTSGKTQVQFGWLGKPPSEQIDYTDRD